jgi:AMP phosphorylase
MASANDSKLSAIKIIQKKLLGKRLTYREIFTVMDEIAHERLGDILTTYFVASGFRNGFTAEELYFMTKSMVDTGTKLHFDGIVADKHSTGGLPGTRTTMIVVPIIAAAGFKIPKTSSRAITTPAGTADVMELLADVTFTPDQITEMVNKVGGCIVWGGKLGLAPADDIIIHVEEPLLFESFDKVIVSIMAKKIAVGANHLILDLPYGKTMKIRHKTDAQIIAQKFIRIGKHFNVDIVPYINHAYEPAGSGIGPYLEAIDVLKVLEMRKDRAIALEKKALYIAGTLLNSCYRTEKIAKDGHQIAEELLYSGAALKKFLEIVKIQGGSDKVSSLSLRSPAFKIQVPHAKSGRISEVNTFNLNAIAKTLGAPIDKYAGIELHAKIKDKVSKHDNALTFHSTNKQLLREAEDMLNLFPVYYYES